MTRHRICTALGEALDHRAFTIFALIGLIIAVAAVSRAANVGVTRWSAVALGSDQRGGIVATFRDDTGASTGFTSFPTARALTSPPRWLSARVASIRTETVARQEARLSLGIVGLPVDVQHDMLRGVSIMSYCFTPQQPSQGIVSLCKDPKQLYDNFSVSGKYNLCDFDPDCWHSTAVAIVATGNRLDSTRHPFESWSVSHESVPLEDSASDTNDPSEKSDTSDSSNDQSDDPYEPGIFHKTTFGKIARDSYEEYYNGYDIGDPHRISFSKFFSARFKGYQSILNKQIEVALIEYNDILTPKRKGRTYNSAFVSRQMIVEKGVRTGGAVFAINVFSRFESAIDCDHHQKPAPCVLTTMGAQEEALRYILKTVEARERNGDTAQGPAPLGAIVIVAGGLLTDKRCDGTSTAKIIGALREHGVLTFVPVGNDGNAAKVRFPACASQAISVGSLTRDGAISDFSNGSKTAMVDLYVDGETVVLPIRGPRLVWGSFSDPNPTPCDTESRDDCEAHGIRKSDDQYDAYLAGGTLLGAAVAAGEFLNLRERHPTAQPEEVLAALTGRHTSSRSQPAEADEYLAEQLLSHP